MGERPFCVRANILPTTGFLLAWRIDRMAYVFTPPEIGRGRKATVRVRPCSSVFCYPKSEQLPHGDTYRSTDHDSSAGEGAPARFQAYGRSIASKKAAVSSEMPSSSPSVCSTCVH